jgi:hypothetical protein
MRWTTQSQRSPNSRVEPGSRAALLRRRPASMALRALQKSLTAGVGTGVFAARFLSKIPVTRYGGWRATPCRFRRPGRWREGDAIVEGGESDGVDVHVIIPGRERCRPSAGSVTVVAHGILHTVVTSGPRLTDDRRRTRSVPVQWRETQRLGAVMEGVCQPMRNC